MRALAPDQRSVHSRSITVLRWLAMSIVAAPQDSRGVQYLTVRRNLADAIVRFGMRGAEAEECLNGKMDLIRELVREIEAIADDKADAA